MLLSYEMLIILYALFCQKIIYFFSIRKGALFSFTVQLCLALVSTPLKLSLFELRYLLRNFLFSLNKDRNNNFQMCPCLVFLYLFNTPPTPNATLEFKKDSLFEKPIIENACAF